MDPLSVSASTLTVIAALQATFRLARSYRDAPAQLEAMNNEISDIAATVTEVDRVIKQSLNNGGPLDDNGSHLTLALSKIQVKARELDAIFHSCVGTPSSVSGETKYSRISWLKVKSKAQRLQTELRDGRLNLSHALALFTAYVHSLPITQLLSEASEWLNTLRDLMVPRSSSQRIELSIRDVFMITKKGMDDQTSLNDRLIERYDQQQSAQDQFNAKILTQLGELQLAPIAERENHDSGAPRYLVTSAQNSLETLRASEQHFSASTVHRSSAAILQNPSRWDSEPDPVEDWTSIGIRAEMKAKITAMYGPEVSLRFNRVVDGKSLVFHYADIGDVTKMKQLFEQGRASPSDVRFDSGWTPLHYAIQNHQVGACRLLLQAGGDPFLETEAPMAAVDYAATISLGQSANAQTINSLHELFLDTASLEHGNFSDLHKIILQIRSGDVEEELSKSTADLDVLDATGRSPLSWAAQRGDVKAVKLLLAYGADPNNSNNFRMTPMHYAAQATNPICLKVLLENGALITQQARGWNALHYICSLHDNPAYVKLLLQHSFDINERTYVGKTALSLAVLRNRIKSAACLIGQGADLDVLDKEGNSPLSLSVKFGRFELMKLLLRSGATHKLLSGGDDTLLHIVAKFPDFRIVEYFLENDLLDVDPEARNKDGLTARELLLMYNSDPKIALAFQKLLSKMSTKTSRDQREISSNDILDDSDSNSSFDVFEDAVE
ncbi:MAG: hypothetical protein L6R41_001784 [Letrouitia leprolyta]|nr:MAG: hypothetical protein L6R41_001784 [Letrouitia leprolyta]